MPITAKELAKKLNLSATAVSMALNNKPGVSRQTRDIVLHAAEKYGYDFSKLSAKQSATPNIYCITYRTHNAILNYAPIFNEITDGVSLQCHESGYRLKQIQINEKIDDLKKWIEDLRVSDCAGIILLGTEIGISACKMFMQLSVPVVLLDSHFTSLKLSSVLIDNIQGAYQATSFLIDRCGKQPGYMRSSYRIENFDERRSGFNKAVREHGMSVSKSIVHELSPSIEGAFSDMLELLEQKEELAECYFADNDLIAIGAIKALKLRGYKIPDDIAIIGFDNISESRIIEPSLTTVDIPRQFMGRTAARQLIYQIENPIPHTVKIQVSTKLVRRFSV